MNITRSAAFREELAYEEPHIHREYNSPAQLSPPLFNLEALLRVTSRMNQNMVNRHSEILVNLEDAKIELESGRTWLGA